MRTRTDEELRQRYGSILQDRSRLRDHVTDEPTARWCRVCHVRMTTVGDEASHNLDHAREGRLVAYIATSHMSVSFVDPERWEGFRDLPTRVRIDPEHLDARSNAIRPVCDECGGYVHLAGRVVKHNREPEGETHEATIRGAL